MAVCSPQTLLNDAACFACLQNAPGMLELVKTSLLCRILQALDPMATCDVQSLLNDAACFSCLQNAPGMLDIIQAQLLCNISEAISGGGASGITCGTEDPTEAPSGTCGVYYRTDTGAVFIWDGSAWQFKV